MDKIKSLLLLIVFATVVGCNDNAVYSEFRSVGDIWKYDSPLEYEMNIDSETEYYNLILSLAFSPDFGYQNLYVKITTEYPDQSLTEDIISFELTDGSGSFLGNCGGSRCEVDIFLQENFKFKSIGKHIIRVYQNSREAELKGIIGGEMTLLNAVKSK